ncbi:MAG TPA: L-histidine N(alpha)-methyltransferase [Kofleriaceae bacterium]|jgi:dimethylhistidine N-methyltransferase
MATTTNPARPAFAGATPATGDDVLDGLRAPHKHLPCRLLYDAEGARLFEQICTLDAYYPTRTEIALLHDNLPVIAQAVGPQARVIEPGSGEGIKTRDLLGALESPSCYVPIDVAADQLAHTATALRATFAGLDVQPLVADYTRPFELPAPAHAWRRSLVFFPGSTIGNFEPADARAFLGTFARHAGPGGLLLLGADSTSDSATLVRAYDDELGVTAAFNKNILAHVNRAHQATFDLAQFDHRAVWNADASRIEMHLVSRGRQLVRVGRESIAFRPGEAIITEHCYKHTPAALQSILAASGWKLRQVFTAREFPFRLWLCETDGSHAQA